MAIEYNHEKFKQAVLYICSKCKPHELGAVKLNKMLWLSDWLQYLQNEGEKALTGATYVKLQHGHVPREVFTAIPELEAEGKLEVEVDWDLVFQRKLFHVANKKSLDTSLITDEEKRLLDRVIAYLTPMTAADASELSHCDEAWERAELNEVIPYETAFDLLNGHSAHYASPPSAAGLRWFGRVVRLVEAGKI